MQEFAANGFVTDDMNRFQYTNPGSVTPPSSQLPPQFPMCPATAMAATVGNIPHSLAAAHWISLNNYREQLNNMWRSMSMPYLPNMANNAALGMPAGNSQKNLNPMGLTVPPDHMRNVNNSNTNNKVNKRLVNGKTKEMVSI